MLKIRAHHLLCLQGHQGKGYDNDFVKNMGEIFRAIQQNKDIEVFVLAGADNICFACPHNKNNKCMEINEANHIDKINREIKLLKFLEIEPNKVYKIHDLYKIVNEKITTKEHANDLYCEKCEWHDVCLWHMSRE